MKDVNYYMKLQYKIEVVALTPEEGDGWSACIPLLGRYSFHSTGDTADEAINGLAEIKPYMFQKMIDSGQPIPEPINLDDFKKYNNYICNRCFYRLFPENDPDINIDKEEFIWCCDLENDPGYCCAIWNFVVLILWENEIAID